MHMNESGPRNFKPPKPEESVGSGAGEKVDSGRRDFLKTIGAGALVVSGIVPFSKVMAAEKEPSDKNNREQIQKSTHEMRKEISCEYGIEIDFSPIFPQEVGRRVMGGPVEEIVQKHNICVAILNSLRQYPSFLVRSAHVPVIRVLNALSYKDNEGTAGLSTFGEGVMHVEYSPRSYNDEVPYEYEDSKEMYANLDTVEETVHHEIEHFLENDGSVQENEYGATQVVVKNGKKVHLMKYAYTYEIVDFVSKGTLSKRDADKILNNTEGFATNYGRSSEHEDRASVAEQMLGPLAPELFYRIKKDVILRNKVNFMKEFFFKKSYGLMNSAYWDFVERGMDSNVVTQYLKEKAQLLCQQSDFVFAHLINEKRSKRISAVELKVWKQQLEKWINENV